MTTYQGNYKSLLGGVSQQVYTDRQLSQVEVQTNMTSDTVRGLRKRPGTRLHQQLDNTLTDWWSPGNYGHLRFHTTNLGWGITTFIVNTITGRVISIVETETVQFIGQSNYLITSNPADIVFATVGSTLYAGNTSKLPALVTAETRMNPNRRGYFFVLAGSYGRVYSLTVRTNLGSVSASYTTPDGTTAGDAAKATGEYIIGQLLSQLTPAIGGAAGLEQVTSTGAYMYIQVTAAAGFCNVATSTGSTYALGSNTHTVDLTSKLPAQLPSAADGFIMTIGDNSFAQYFEWVHSQTRWIETGAYNSPTSINPDTMPLLINATAVTNQHAISTGTWPGRKAGDDKNNDIPAFADADLNGITGLASFQGRLIIFSGPYITMGSSSRDDKNNFFRTTVTQMLDSDRIEFTATSFAGASFKYGIPFNSDLILASEEHQGVIPGRNQILTPQNATALLTSTYQMDLGSTPTTSGRSLYFAYPRSSSSFSMKEMVPSGSTDLQYVSQDVTDHLPTYLEGAATYISASTTNNVLVIGSSDEQYTLYVNEYLWSGDEKVLSSWHKWTFDGRLHAAWFVRETLVMIMEQAGHINLITLSMRDSPDLSDESRYLPALDNTLSKPVFNKDSQFAGEPYLEFADTGVDKALWDIILLGYASDTTLSFVTTVVTTGPYIGAMVGPHHIDAVNRRLYLHPTYGTDTLTVGVRFTAEFSPTPPRIFDSGGGYVAVDKLVIQCYDLTMRYTSDFTVTASDRGGVSLDELSSSAIDYTSQELSLDNAPLAKRSHLRVRVGLEAESSSTVFRSNTHGDFNLQGLGYLVKFNNKVRRI